MIYLRTLGESVIEVGDARIGPSAPHMFAALLYLALEAGRRVPRARLQELLFPTSDERKGSHSLRQLLYRLRRLGVDLQCDAHSVTLPIDKVRADYQELLGNARMGRRSTRDLVRGLLPGCDASYSRSFREWLDERRAELLGQFRRRLTDELREHRRLGRWSIVEETARALLGVDPLNEQATLSLAESVALTGSKVQAVKILDAYLAEVDDIDYALRSPVAVLRKRIAERLPAAAPPAYSRFVGRDSSLFMLRELMSYAVNGEAVTCHIWGEAGIGKTRLVTEFTRAAILDGARVERVSSQPHDQRRPMGAFSDLVPALLRLPGSLGCSPDAIAFLTRLISHHSDSGNGTSPDVREAELLSANITRAISELLDASSAESPVVLVLEDAQWLDNISLQVFADLIAERKRRALLLILTSRGPLSGLTPPDAGCVRELRLEPLDATDARLLFAELLVAGGGAADGELLDWCLGVAAGNPFFIHSLAAYYLVTRDRRAIPEPLQALLIQRLNLLDARARRLFEACSVLGRHSTFETLEQVLGIQIIEFLDALQSLEQHGFIRLEGSLVRSSHSLLSEMALARASPTVRALLHRNSARALQQVPLGNGSAALWDSAEHWLQSGDRAQALVALRACARHALEIGQPNDACDVLQRAVRLGDTVASRMATLEQLILASEIAERWEVVAESIDSYVQLAAQQGVPVEPYHPYRILEIEARVMSGADPLPCVSSFRAYVHDVSAPMPVRLRAATQMMRLAEELVSWSLAQEALDALGPMTDAEAGVSPERLRMELSYHMLSGQLEECAALARLAVKDDDRDILRSSRRLWLAGLALLRAGHVDEGCSALEKSVKVARQGRLDSLELHGAVSLACVLRDSGRNEEARSWHLVAASRAHQIGGRRALDFFANSVLFALDDRDFASAKHWLRRAQEVPASRSGYPRLIFLALQIRVAQLAESYDCSMDELRQLLSGHFESRALGHHDEVVVTLWHALAKKGRREYANYLLQDYLKHHRRIRWPLCPELRQLAGDLT